MLHNVVFRHGGKGVLVFGETNIPVAIDRVQTSCDELAEIECHQVGAVYMDTGANRPKKDYSKCYRGWFDNFAIRQVIFNDPATIVIWADGTKTVVKCQDGDVYSEEVGLAMCFMKKALGNKGNFNEVFKKYIPEKEEEEPIQLPVPSPAEVISKFKQALHQQRGME